MYSFLVSAVRAQNGTDFPSETLPLIFLTFESVLFFITDILFIFLIAYRKWKKTEDATNFQYHSPIFNQLFYCSAACLVFNNFLFLGAFITDFDSTDTFIIGATLLFILIETYTASLIGVFFASISIFSFLAVIQRIVILYLPSYKCFVMGFVQ
ncbi:hypothetical protein B9Z55_021012 [Caenorhabditis nigoni]|uniref:Serpentine receptor class gamma n=1 Tax=Caenorhabditis nigoni TaxID=1611254 RepID=A0A2G5TQB9_9PELO|nr:hypothetical protein B9Z55_021012 [Caenorhabditis nigoni]